MARRLTGPEGRPLNLWEKLSTRSHSNLYFALLFTDRQRRGAFRDVYRFARVADDIVDSPGDPDVVRASLAQWRTELDAVYDGSAVHPYAVRLSRAVARYQLERADFDQFFDGLVTDIGRTSVRDDDELWAYCDSVAGSLARLSLTILGAPRATDYGRDVARALQVANILRDVAEDAGRGRIYLPRARLDAAGVDPATIYAGRSTPELRGVCRDLAREARHHLERARASIAPADRPRLLVPEIWADVYLALLDQLEACGYEVLGRPPYLSRRTKMKLALRRWGRHTNVYPASYPFRRTDDRRFSRRP